MLRLCSPTSVPLVPPPLPVVPLPPLVPLPSRRRPRRRRRRPRRSPMTIWDSVSSIKSPLPQHHNKRWRRPVAFCNDFSSYLPTTTSLNSFCLLSVYHLSSCLLSLQGSGLWKQIASSSNFFFSPVLHKNQNVFRPHAL